MDAGPFVIIKRDSFGERVYAIIADDLNDAFGSVMRSLAIYMHNSPSVLKTSRKGTVITIERFSGDSKPESTYTIYDETGEFAGDSKPEATYTIYETGEFTP